MSLRFINLFLRNRKKKVILFHGSYTDELAEMIKVQANLEIIKKERKLFVAESNSQKLFDLLAELSAGRNVLIRERKFELVVENRTREWEIVKVWFGIYTECRSQCSYKTKNEQIYIILFR